jgi:peptidoglycan/LPS O-acetylase OafA/YrhL
MDLTMAGQSLVVVDTIAAVSNGASSQHPYRSDIDGLRALSILMVVAFHAGVAGMAGGYVGVDVFFVLSGYLITGLLVAEHGRNGRISLRSFFARRFRRLLPLAFSVIAVTLLLGFWLLPPVRRPELVSDAVSSSFYVANWRFASQASTYSDFAVTDGLLLHYWSLSVEEQFYLLWPLLVVCVVWLTRWRRLDLLPMLRVVIGVIVASSLLASVVITSERGPSAYYFTHTRLWELGAGALLAVWMPRIGRLPASVAAWLSAGGLLAIMAAAFTYDDATRFPGSAALLPVVGAAALILAGTRNQPWISRGLARWPLPLLGRLSYAWYLWHWPIIGLGLLFNERHGAPLSVGAVTALAVVGSLGLAWASHILVENPVRRWSWLEPDRRSLLLGASLSVLPLLFGLALIRIGDTGDRAVALPPAAEGGTGLDLHAAINPMSPAQAADDTPRLGRGSCHSGRVETINVGEDCAFGDASGSTTIALIGDSHAQHWLPSFDAAGAAHGWRVLSWTKSSCPAIDVMVWDHRSGEPFDECAQWFDTILDRLSEEPELDAIVLARSHGYQRSVVDDEGRRVSGDDSSPDLAAALWEAGVRKTFDAFLEVAPTVVVLRDTPWAPHDVPSCLSASSADPSTCAFGLSDAAYLDAEFHAVELEAASTGVEFVDLTSTVCPTDPCDVVTDTGVIKFSDRHHLTSTFAGQLGPDLWSKLDPVLRRG